MVTASLQWVYRLGFLWTTACANVVSTHGSHAQVEITSAGEVVRTNGDPAQKPLKTLADGIQLQIAKAMATGFDTVTSHVETDSYLLGGNSPTVSELNPSYPVLEPPAYKTVLKNEGNGSFYTVSMCFGKTPQGVEEMCLPGIPDTGSFELVVRSSRCLHCTEPMYNDSQSLSFVGQITKNNSTQLMYGSGPVKALWVEDDVKIQGSDDGTDLMKWTTWKSGFKATGIIVPQQKFMEATASPIQDFAKGKEMAGIFGIGRGLAHGREGRFIKRAGIKRYSICLPRDETKNGTMWWSSKDMKNNSLYKAINVVGQFHWAVELTHMKLHYQQKAPMNMPRITSLTTGRSCAILDSGTTLISPTTEMATKLFAAIEGQGLDCKDVSKLPVLEFQLDGHSHYLPPEAYVANFNLADENITAMSKKLLHIEPKQGCMLLLTKPMDMEQPGGTCPAMILGMPFFRFYKTVFDWDAPSEKKTTDTGMVFTTEHSDCEDGQNSWDEDASNFVGKSTTGLEKKPVQNNENRRKLMTINFGKIKWPKAPAHYLQHGKL